MHPVLFRILGKEIYSYGAMAALGLLAAILTWQWLDRREDRPPGFAADLGFWLMVSGIVGSRVTYVMANWSYYRSAPLEIIRINQGGLIFYGGLILGATALALWARHHRLPLWHAADFAIPGLAIGHALGRIGCFLNGCCYGRRAKPGAASPILRLANPGGYSPECRSFPYSSSNPRACWRSGPLCWSHIAAATRMGPCSRST